MIFHFLRPWWLLLLPIVVALWWRRQHWLNPTGGWRALMEPQFVDALTIGHQQQRNWSHLALLLCGVLAVISVAGPTWSLEPSPFSDDVVPVMLVLKASESMSLTDLMPSRMERAQLKIVDFSKQRSGQPLGLIAYAGSAHLVLPPTKDTSVLSTMASEISPEILPKPGEDVIQAIKLADRTLENVGGTIVIVADAISKYAPEDVSEFRKSSANRVIVWAIAREQTPELDSIRTFAREIDASVVVMSSDQTDAESLVRMTARKPVAVAEKQDGARWQEAGWWLVPFVALSLLTTFRREEFIHPKGETL
ncbi:VWA domain-containing protein [Thalassoglobus sp. JC818]|uniref:VWA domain-containing protein n=1 Tax=Thalassoglobus sp. JC818 TaxID=3232136 RepID=UPI0034578800